MIAVRIPYNRNKSTEQPADGTAKWLTQHGAKDRANYTRSPKQKLSTSYFITLMRKCPHDTMRLLPSAKLIVIHKQYLLINIHFISE